MKLLIIGGTKFLGRHLVDAALARGHVITLFNRGKTGPELFPKVEKLHGDRDVGLEALAGRTWDAVIDTCGYFPRIVGASARFLAPAVGHYTFISTMSVYARNGEPDEDESAEVATLPDPTVEDASGEFYGGLKALCEQAVLAAMTGRTLVIRPGLIVGLYDPSDRYTYWPERIARGGEVLAPAPADQPVQYIDVRDLAEWTVRMVEAGATGIFNATGPQHSFGEMLAACGTEGSITWVPEEFLVAQGLKYWMELPLWLPESWRGHSTRNIDKAVAAGLTFRPRAVTAVDTLRWAVLRRAGARKAGMAPDREAEVLQKWHAR